MKLCFSRISIQWHLFCLNHNMKRSTAMEKGLPDQREPAGNMHETRQRNSLENSRDRPQMFALGFRII